MKFIKWKTLIVTSLVCLWPILLGLFLWEKLPDTMAIHFDLNNNPDNFAPKGFVVFGMPCLMVALQWICCLINDINAKKHGSRMKFERVTKWIIPIMTVLLQLVTFGIGLGAKINVRAVVAFIVGVMFISTGNYLPKLDYIKDYDLSADKARKINRFIGFATVIMGVLFLISIFLPPLFTAICLALLIPYAVSSAIYGIKVGKGK
ncbi:MAG: DUF1648 domain-containing protein [Clostridia bacterium]|nr:DUF1648 domain-containing protein [Clostridia bacterium]